MSTDQRIGDRLNLFDEGFQRELDAYYPYDRAGAFWSIYRYSHRLQIQLVSEMIGEELTPQKLLLDAGCECGPYSMMLSNKVRVVAVDLSPTAIRKAKNWRKRKGKDSQVDFIIGDIQHLPLKDSIFDIVICLEVLEHIPFITEGLKELYGVLKADGLGLISMPNSLSLYYILQRLLPVVTPTKENPHLKFTFMRIKNVVSSARVGILDVKSSLMIPVILPSRFYEEFVRGMRLLESKLNGSPFRNLGAHYMLKIQKPRNGHSKLCAIGN